MGQVYDIIDDSLREFIERQHVFFVATAPLAKDGLINLSPKGLDSLRVLDQQTVAYADLIGSGIETVAPPEGEWTHRRDVLRVGGASKDCPTPRPRRSD